MQKTLIILCIALGGAWKAYSQNSIKLQQQSTTFFYTQLNLHTGFSNAGDGLQFGLPGRGSANQLSFQLQKIHQPLLQKGYTPLIALDSWRVRTNLSYSQSSSTFTVFPPNQGGPGQGGPGNNGENPVLVGTTTTGHVNLNLQDAWLKFKTKWDRTTVKIGYGTILYGHHPDMDANASFMTNVVSTDLGLNRDLGIFIKTPLSRDLDLEMGLSTGGALSNPLFQTNAGTDADETPDAAPNGRYLLAGRIGRPSFHKNELGLLVAVGRVNSTFGSDPDMSIIRVGGEWIYKFRERLRLTNQLVVGQSQTESQGDFFSFTMQNNLDLFLSQNLILGMSNSLNVQNGEGGNFVNSTLAGSLTYVLSPHTRFRLNSFASPRSYDGSSNYGISLQFVTGLGKR